MILVRTLVLAVVPAALCALAACDAAPLMQAGSHEAGHAGVSVSATSGGSAAPAPQTPVPGTSPPTAAGAAGTPDYAALDQTADPARVALFLAAALQDGRWADAARAWGAQGDAAALKQRFGAGAPIRLTVGSGESEGAAGSLYYSAPYRLRRADGSGETGTLVLRRVNDVPGASAASLRWHVEAMDPAP